MSPTAARISPAAICDLPPFFTHTNSTDGVLIFGSLSDVVGQSSGSSSATAAFAVRPTPRMVADPGPVQSP